MHHLARRPGVPSLALSLVGLLLVIAPAQADPRKNPTRTKKVLDRIVAFFRFESPRTATLLRGDDQGRKAGAVWLVARDGSDPRRLTEGTGFRSPVFLQGGEDLLALQDDRLVWLDAHSGKVKRQATLTQRVPVEFILGVSERGLGLLTAAHTVVLVTDDGRTVDSPDLSGSIDEMDVRDLKILARSCRGMVVASRQWVPDRSVPIKRTDVVLMAAGKDPASPELEYVTGKLSTRLHTDPAFSPNCSQVAFVGE